MKVIALSMALSLGTSLCYSQDHPFVEEGKVWNMLYQNPEASDVYPDYQFCYYIKGDTLISGSNCKKLYVYNENNNDSTAYLMSLFEEGRKVFFIPKGSTSSFVLYDFGIPVGAKSTVNDAIHPEWEITMRNIEEKDVGTQASIWHCWLVNRVMDDGSEVVDLGAGTWIEGIGSELGPLATWEFEVAGNSRFLLYCDLNGQRIFSLTEFKDNYTGIKSVNRREGQGCESSKNFEGTNSKNLLHDLRGRRLQQAPQKGIYIQDGRKRVVQRTANPSSFPTVP